MRILFVHNSLRSFVKIDRDLLAEVHEVDELDLSKPLRIVTLPSRLAKADLVFIWFASLHSFLPAIFGAALRKPVVSVVGAYDAANFPEINFGHMASPWKKYLVRAVCGASTLLMCNSDYAVETVRKNVRPRTPIRRVYHGFEFPDTPISNERERMALTVGEIRWGNVQRKGFEMFVRTAALLPDVRFVLAGRIMDDSVDYLHSVASANVEIRDQLTWYELQDYYDRASVYVQASITESFGMTVAEAMGRGDSAVVSRKGALPEVAGEFGIYVDEPDAGSIAAGIEEGLSEPLERRVALAEHARKTFPISARRAGVLAVIREAAGRLR